MVVVSFKTESQTIIDGVEKINKTFFDAMSRSMYRGEKNVLDSIKLGGEKIIKHITESLQVGETAIKIDFSEQLKVLLKNIRTEDLDNVVQLLAEFDKVLANIHALDIKIAPLLPTINDAMQAGALHISNNPAVIDLITKGV
jgi:hypothetical protein